MRKKPKGQRYRNLFARDGVIYYQRRVDGARVKWSAKTDDWDEAAAVRDLWEERGLIGSTVPHLRAPTFGEFAARYLVEATGKLAATTRHDRSGYLREGGPLLRHFAD